MLLNILLSLAILCAIGQVRHKPSTGYRLLAGPCLTDIPTRSSDGCFVFVRQLIIPASL